MEQRLHFYLLRRPAGLRLPWRRRTAPSESSTDQVNTDVQRVSVVDLAKHEVATVSPAGLYVFEFDWSPDGNSLAYTAAPPPGDDNWYLAQLYTQPLSRPQSDFNL